MPGTILENLSGRKLAVLVSILVIVEIVCFLIGGFIAPPPAGTFGSMATICKDPTPNNLDVTRFLTTEKGKCELVNLEDANGQMILTNLTAKDLVFVIELPNGSPRRDFSRWQQNLVGVLDLHIAQMQESKIDNPIELTLDARLAYKNKGDMDWTYHSHAVEKRLMDCGGTQKQGSHVIPHNCTTVPLFELSSLHHDYYLLNLRLPSTNNHNFGWFQVVYLHCIHMNGGFTMVWLALKTLFFPAIAGVMGWFWRRVHILERTPALLEYMLMGLGGALLLLDAPIEYLSLYIEMPYMLLLSDIRQGVFYAMLLLFWLVFAGEHMLIRDTAERNALKLYWKHLSAIVVGCASLLIFDLCERGVQLRNPFYTIWVTPVGANLALSFIVLAGISACIYFVFLCYMIWTVFTNISVKRSSLLNMSSARRLHYEGIIYRFNFLMLATLLCAAITIVSFILSQVNEGHHKWDDNMEHIELSSALFTGVYGMWNIYIIAMLILYAPSHKKWPSEPIYSDNAEEVEFNQLPSEGSVNEISSLTSFASKATTD